MGNIVVARNWLVHEALRARFRLQRRDLYLIDRKIVKNEKSGYCLRPFNDTRSVFVHIPKTAGISLANSLYGCGAGGHRTLLHYQKHYSYTKYNSYFKFTFVRNPWDRIYSAFNFLKRQGMNKSDAEFSQNHLAEFTSFEEFILNGITRKEILDYVHFRPQLPYIVRRGGRIGVDFIGLFENLEADYQYVCGRLGHRNFHVLEKMNIQPHGVIKSYADKYTNKMKEVVSEVYGDDICVLGYNFDNSSLERQLRLREKLLDKKTSVLPVY